MVIFVGLFKQKEKSPGGFAAKGLFCLND